MKHCKKLVTIKVYNERKTMFIVYHDYWINVYGFTTCQNHDKKKVMCSEWGFTTLKQTITTINSELQEVII